MTDSVEPRFDRSSAHVYLGVNTPARQGLISSQNCTASLFGEVLLLREAQFPGGHLLRPDLALAEPITRAVRGALLHHAIDPPPPSLYGHGPDGSRMRGAHTAFLALPGPGARGARVEGLAIVLPRAIPVEERQAIWLAAHRWEQSNFRLLLGRLGAMTLTRVDVASLQGDAPEREWLSPSMQWESVTPVALDRNPGELFSADHRRAAQATLSAERTIADACAHVGLPSPAEVRILRAPSRSGIPGAAQFMPFPRVGSGLKRVCVHVTLRFDQAVMGPVMLGAGRHFGVGLLRPR